MKNQDFQTKINSMQEKIGQEAANLILDDIGLFITDNQNMNKDIEKLQEKIKSLEDKNQKLIEVNGNLLQQIPMGTEEDLKPEIKKEEKKEPFDFRSAFDEYGNFKQ